MWSCNYGPWVGGWRGGFFPGHLWGVLLWGLVIVLLVYIVVRLFRPRDRPGPQRIPGSRRFPDHPEAAPGAGGKSPRRNTPK